MRYIFVLLVLLPTVPSEAQLVKSSTSASITVTASTTANSVQTTFTVTVANLPANKNWRDLHFDSARRYRFPRISTSTTVSIQQNNQTLQTWNIRRRSGGSFLDVYTGTESGDPSGLGNGTYTFTITWNPSKASKTKSKPIVWRAMSDGTSTVNSNEDDVLDDDDDQPNSPKVPQLKCSLSDTDARLSTTIDLVASTAKGFSGYTYEIYTSVKKNSNYTDPLGIGIETSSHPVPASWNLTFLDMTGTLNSTGVPTSAPSITTSQTPELVGRSLYAVFAVKNSQGEIVVSSAPATITIRE